MHDNGDELADPRRIGQSPIPTCSAVRSSFANTYCSTIIAAMTQCSIFATGW
jgi:hypothetical protein